MYNIEHRVGKKYQNRGDVTIFMAACGFSFISL